MLRVIATSCLTGYQYQWTLAIFELQSFIHLKHLRTMISFHIINILITMKFCFLSGLSVIFGTHVLGLSKTG